MKSSVGLATIMSLLFSPVASGQPQLQTGTLSNGIQVVVVHFPQSTNFSLFTFLPLGLASDAAGQTQWAHLIEHLQIRSSVTGELVNANAETLADHMRLDFYGQTNQWRHGLKQQVQWLGDVQFTQRSLEKEKPLVVAESAYAVKNLATHKFATAAWAQGLRHGVTNVGLNADVLSAPLKAVQGWRDAHLVVLDKTTICAVGGVDYETFFAQARRDLEKLKSRAKPPSGGRVRPQSLDVRWDLDARHLVMAWPIPGPDHEDHAVLMVLAHQLMTKFFGDQSLRALVGQVYAATDVIAPEGQFFQVSASLRPEADMLEVEKKIADQIERLSKKESELAGVNLIGQQIAFSLTRVLEPAALQAQMPAGSNLAMVEGNIGLVYGMNAHRYGENREETARRARNVSPDALRRVAAKYLTTDKGCHARIYPAKPAGNEGRE